MKPQWKGKREAKNKVQEVQEVQLKRTYRIYKKKNNRYIMYSPFFSRTSSESFYLLRCWLAYWAATITIMLLVSREIYIFFIYTYTCIHHTSTSVWRPARSSLGQIKLQHLACVTGALSRRRSCADLDWLAGTSIDAVRLMKSRETRQERRSRCETDRAAKWIYKECTFVRQDFRCLIS